MLYEVITNIVAKTAPKRLRTVLFELTGAQNHTDTDNKRPHTLFGDDNNNYEQWAPPLGSYTLTASPLLLIGPGPGLTVSFTVVQNSADPPNQPPVANA